MTDQARLLLKMELNILAVFYESFDVFGEIVFNTAMSGYQEVLTDPSYSNQCVLMTSSDDRNYGINNDDIESKSVYLNALLCKEYVDQPSNWQSVQTLKSYLEDHGKIGVEGLDTRSITLHIRSQGAQRVLITSDCDSSKQTLLKKIESFPKMAGLNLANLVSVGSSYTWNQSKDASKFKLAVLDCGVKYNILRHFEKRGCECHVIPIDQADQILSDHQFDGLFISNGPGILSQLKRQLN